MFTTPDPVVIGSLTVILPDPSNFIVLFVPVNAAPVETSKVKVFASDAISLVPPKVIRPDKVLFPDVDLIPPARSSPVPVRFIASPILIPPEICKTAPSAIVVAPSVVPKEFALVAIRTPLEIVVAPV
ncbi:hypothetical protein N9N39_01505 [Candidatus Pelagibacter bacterium]|nr:hypothetical protein [Candidatus Pelagibacter bacterium]MDA8825397.1 hypothetical protein [Candidatus Pelagibacter bacterium]